jgi:two-component system chemotaxis response regulator CheB
VVIGASAGGIEALTSLVKRLPAEFPAALFVVVHLPSSAPSVLPRILGKAGRLPAVAARQGERIERGRMYVAVPDKHLLVQGGHIHVVHGPRENRQRPAIDPLFRSAALAYGPRVIGVVLSGNLDDGTAGLRAIKARGGLAIVQDPHDALYSGMPESAIEHVKVDAVLPTAELADLLAERVQETVALPEPPPASDVLQYEVHMADTDNERPRETRPGAPSAFACPECGGALWELPNGEYIQFRCRVGHAFSPESLMAEMDDSVDSALWVALRALEENASMSRRLAKQAAERGHPRSRARFEERAEEMERHATIVRQVLISQSVANVSQATSAD